MSSDDDPQRDDERDNVPDEGQAKAERIAALEAELAALRGVELAARRGAERGDLRNAGGAPVEAWAEEDLTKKSRVQAIVVAVVVLAVGLALIFGLFAALARGFDSFADTAAKKLVPGAEDDDLVQSKPLRGAKSLRALRKPDPGSSVGKAAPSPAPDAAPSPAPKGAPSPAPKAAPSPAPKTAPPRPPIQLPGL